MTISHDSDIHELAENWVDQKNIPGLILRIDKNNETIFNEAVGTFTLGGSKKLSHSTPFHTASVGKLFTSLTVLNLYVDSFGTFHYPSSSIVIADASLFFCPQNELKVFFQKVKSSLSSNGVFYGSFLGSRDTMALV